MKNLSSFTKLGTLPLLKTVWKVDGQFFGITELGLASNQYASYILDMSWATHGHS